MQNRHQLSQLRHLSLSLLLRHRLQLQQSLHHSRHQYLRLRHSPSMQHLSMLHRLWLSLSMQHRLMLLTMWWHLGCRCRMLSLHH